jgi:hypothetical protein
MAMAKLTMSQRNKLSSSQFVFPKTRKFPIQDKGHAQYAVRIAAIQYGKGIMSATQYNQVINAVNKKFGFKAQLKSKAPVKKIAVASKRNPIRIRK